MTQYYQNPSSASRSELINWFRGDLDDGALDPATDAFQDAIIIFSNELTKDKAKRDLISRSDGFEDLQKTLTDVQHKYESARAKSRPREYLNKFSSLLCHYDNMMKCLIQHNPEYVSLAWGAMKLLFVAFVNHENAVCTLAKGLCQIGSILPRVELSLILYPTSRMKRAVAEVYAYILKFLIWAKRWYEEGKLKHIWHSLTRPSELRYDDLLENILERSSLIDNWSASGARVEQREIHRKIDSEGLQLVAMRQEIREMKVMLSAFQAMASGAFINSNSRLTDLQFAQMMQSLQEIPNHCLLPEPEVTYKYNTSLQKAIQRNTRTGISCTFGWASSRLSAFSSAPDLRSLVIIRGTYHSREQTRGLSITALQLLRSSNIPVVWALKGPNKGSTALTAASVLRYLIIQAMKLSDLVPTELDASLNCARFHRAKTAEDYIAIFACLLSSVSNIYIVMDIDIAEAFSWVEAISSVFAQLEQRGNRTRLRVLLFTNRPIATMDGNKSHLVIKAPSNNNMVTRPGSGRPDRRGAATNFIGSRAAMRRGLRLT
ncbi:hypothetical protein QBC36DRAFT_331347 [Triangularia setosa]|uniref:DUF7708 domain-containing protein n=1 Tax=Triangularia setosa TaxID=2587417 RepID=A0AAN7A7S6_9PEZI|nr:hypothetical protein QBC36DRAFT_331347 [Podospora setosa]